MTFFLKKAFKTLRNEKQKACPQNFLRTFISHKKDLFPNNQRLENQASRIYPIETHTQNEQTALMPVISNSDKYITINCLKIYHSTASSPSTCLFLLS
ncbi:hypothetical protein AT248_03530 [Bartonella henselae]|nr:hypothetical protein AT242_05775 [Bartonella henselae]OLL57050.1 hypothetical protein AT248_03530 [Bartonella henselae]